MGVNKSIIEGNIREGMRIKSYLGDVNPIPNNYIQVGLFSE
jgi:hypothetical protein